MSMVLVDKKNVLPISLFFLLLAIFFKFELNENYSELDVPRKHEQKIRSIKNILPSHHLEKLIQLFIVTTKVIQGRSRIAKPTRQMLSGVSRIIPGKPKVLTIEEQERLNKQRRILEQVFLHDKSG